LSLSPHAHARGTFVHAVDLDVTEIQADTVLEVSPSTAPHLHLKPETLKTVYPQPWTLNPQTLNPRIPNP